MTREMDAESFREKIETLDQTQWQVLIKGFLGQSDKEIAKSLYTTEPNVRKHFSKMFRHFDVPAKRGIKRTMLYALMARHKEQIVEFLTDWEDVRLLIRISKLLRMMDRSDKEKLINESDDRMVSLLTEALK